MHILLRLRGEQLYCRIYIDGQRSINDFSIGVKVNTSEWDSKAQLLKGRHNAEINRTINGYKDRFRGIYNDMVAQGETITPETVKKACMDAMAGKNRKKAPTPLEVYDAFIEHQKNMGGISDGTLRTYSVRRNWVIKYSNEKLGAKTTVDTLPKTFPYDFLAFIKKHGQLDGKMQGKENGQNMANKIVQSFIQALNVAIDLGLVESHPFGHVKFKFEKNKEPEFLTAEEKGQIAQKKFDMYSHQVCADVFLIMCETGLGYAEMVKFAENPFKHIENDGKGREWIIVQRGKNENHIMALFTPLAKSIMEKYAYKITVYQNATLNRYLKTVAKLCGIDKCLHTHLGRKTFGHLELLEGTKLELVSKMLGHSRISTTQQHYARVTFEQLVKEL